MQLRRSHTIHLSFMLVGTVFLARLFFIQVLSSEYQFAAEKNIIQPIIEQPYRGAIYDRNGQFLVYNVPTYDLMVTPKEIKQLNVKAFCKDFAIDVATFKKALQKAKAYSPVKPSLFLKNISQANWARIQDHFADYLGFSIQPRTVREYPHPILANTLGYVGEISAGQLAKDTSNYYRSGDIIGISGLEQTYDKVLRGKPGICYEVSDAKGRGKGSFKKGALDQPSTPGQALQTTIDLGLQVYAEQLMKNKLGSVVAIAPQTGEVLAMLSSPSYDPNLLRGRKFSTHFAALEGNQQAPLFHRPTMATYPPGSIFKVSQALIGLQNRLISSDTTYPCHKKPINCHYHPSPLNLLEAIKHSCNPYFYHVFQKIVNPPISNNAYQNVRIGLEGWSSQLKDFGFGRLLGIDLPGEKSGTVPDLQLYDKLYGKMRWKASTIRSLDIGQGELLITPLQMANFAAIVANRGYYYVPHLCKQIGAQPHPKMPIKHTVSIQKTHFDLMADAMQEGVEAGTSRRVRVKDIAICAKTGTSENPHGEDHSICIAFAPKENPQIALAVCVENAGWGGRAAAAIAGLLIEQHLKGSIKRPWMQDYVLKGNFFH